MWKWKTHLVTRGDLQLQWSTVVDWEMVSPIWQPKLILSLEIVARPEPTGWMDGWIAQGHPSNDKDDGLIKTVLVH